MEEIRECSKCGDKHPLNEYPIRTRRDGSKVPHTWCMRCMVEYQAEYRRLNADRLREQKREYVLACKAEGLQRFGARCACCGETELAFLTLDHIDGREPGDKATGQKAWVRAKARGWVGYQILCWNCNGAKGVLGVCPHQIGDDDACQ